MKEDIYLYSEFTFEQADNAAELGYKVECDGNYEKVTVTDDR